MSIERNHGHDLLQEVRARRWRPGFVDGIGTGMILGWLMYKSGLVGRRMALVGPVGGAMLATSGAAVLLGFIPRGGAVQGLLTLPEIAWEAFLGLYLLFKDFKPSPVFAPEIRERAAAPVYAAV